MITKEMVDRLSSEFITKKEYDVTIGLINKRVQTIWRKICEISKRKLIWWAFDNDVELGNGDGSTGGEFDPKEYREFINVTGEFRHCSYQDYKFNDCFPTQFLWMKDNEWVKIVEDNYKESKEKHENAQVKAQVLKQKAASINKNIYDSIRSKLTPEELKHVKFVNP